jgi:mono/diheme cytochrome c family protein
MSRIAFAFVLISALPQAATAADEHLTDQQRLGWRLFETSCGVCHTRPTLIAGLYGPELNKETAGGNEEVMRGLITNGTPRMPAFKHYLDRTEIDAIIAYLKAVPAAATR